MPPPLLVKELTFRLGSFLAFGVAMWLALGWSCAWLIGRDRQSGSPCRRNPILLTGYLTLLRIPVALAAAWVSSSPAAGTRLFVFFFVAALIPLMFYLVWEFRLAARLAGASPAQVLVLPAISAFLTLVLLEIVGQAFSKPDLFNGVLAVSSPDRRYWYYVRHILDGENRANAPRCGGPSGQVTGRPPSAPGRGYRIRSAISPSDAPGLMRRATRWPGRASGPRPRRASARCHRPAP
jgi:hypothetical protein